MISWDTETSGFSWFRGARIIGHVFGYDPGDGYGPRGVYFPIRHQTTDRQLPVDAVTEMVRSILEDPEATVVGHHLKFDLAFARVDGIEVKAKLHDTMVMAALLDENNSKVLEDLAIRWGVDEDAYEMKAVVQKILTEECKRRKVKKKAAPGYAWIPVPVLGQYGCKDGYNTLGVCAKLLPFVQRGWWDLYGTEMALLPVLERGEFAGMPIDVPYLMGVDARARARAASLEEKIWRLAGFRLRVSSDADLRDYLYGHLGYPVTHLTKSDLAAVDERALKAMMRLKWPTAPLIKTLLDWREVDKIASTYTTSILARTDDNGRLHAKFEQLGANTGRLSCRDPNLQNIPSNDEAGIRRAFLVPPGRVRIYLDYSQVELRVLAFYAREPTMLSAFLNGEDIHTRTSLELFGTDDKKMRRIAKVINFGLSYGMSAMGVMENLNKTADPEKGIDYVTEEQAQGFLDRFHARYPRIMEFCHELWGEMSRHNPPQFTNIFGRTRRLPDLLAFGSAARRAQRQAIASEIQGTSADVTKQAIVRVEQIAQARRAQGVYDAQFVNTIHDEIQLDVDRDGAYQAVLDFKAAMEDFPQLHPVPIVVDAEWSATTWADKQSVWSE